MSIFPMALELTPEGAVVPVEAPPCGHYLYLPEKKVSLRCDRPAGHAQDVRHRQFLKVSPAWAVHWCDDSCATPCAEPRGFLETLRAQGIDVRTGWEE